MVTAVTLLAPLAAAAFRSTTGALFAPIEGEFGWTRTQLSGPVTANLIIYGLVAPLAAVLMDRFSWRRWPPPACPGRWGQRPDPADD